MFVLKLVFIVRIFLVYSSEIVAFYSCYVILSWCLSLFDGTYDCVRPALDFDFVIFLLIVYRQVDRMKHVLSGSEAVFGF